MGRRGDILFDEDFDGLNLSKSPKTLKLSEAQKADNIFIESGNLTKRPGRVEVSSDQQNNPGTPLGLKDFFPINTGIRSLILVRTDGVFIHRPIE